MLIVSNTFCAIPSDAGSRKNWMYVQRSRCQMQDPLPSVPCHPSASAIGPASSSRPHRRDPRCLLYINLYSSMQCAMRLPVDVANIRRADSFPTQRAIDWLKAARCITKGERRAARIRMDDMMAYSVVLYSRCLLLWCLKCEVCGVWFGLA